MSTVLHRVFEDMEGDVDYEWQNDGFIERLKWLIERVSGGSIGAFAKLGGLPDATLRRYVSGETEPNRTNLAKLAFAGQCRVGWLANAEGDGPAGAQLQVLGDAWEVPLFEAELSAGPGRDPWSEAQPEDLLRLPGRFLRETLRAQGPLIALRVCGDSMEPTIRDGSIALLDTSVARVDRDGQVYAFRMDGALLIKRAHWLPGTGIRLAGDNPAAPAVELDTSDAERLIVLGRVVGVLNRP